MFIDRAKVEVRAGKGGDGAIAFLTEKYIDRGGPAGGNGGRGGSVIFKASKSVTTLVNFRHSRVITAEDGGKGLGKNCYGRGAEDVVIEVPIGTVVFLEPEHNFVCDLAKDGATFTVAKGGRGGRGNACFKNSVNRTPKIAENGVPGEKKKLTLELKLLADVGLIGFPSVGKSTLLSVISSARPEIGEYAFTTLVPNLGVVYLPDGRSFVAADLPGLIEGAHLGKGLGLQFLRHIERCRVIIHIVDMTGDRDPYDDFKKINKELKEYGFDLIKRPMLIVASKMDEEGSEKKLAAFKKKMVGKTIFPISSLTHEGVNELLYKAADLLDKTAPFPIGGVPNEDQTMKVYDATKTNASIFNIVKRDPHTFVVQGERIERTYKMINITTDEGMLKLISYLRKVGVDARLREMGAQDGDTVILVDFEFEYVA